MDDDFKVGDIVKSLKGHDKNHLFLVVSIDNFGFLAIIDGRYRKIGAPKRKNPKHVEFVAHDEALVTRLNSVNKNAETNPITNAELYKLINTKNEGEICRKKM